MLNDEESENYDQTCYIIILVFSIIFLIIFFIYFISIITYIRKNFYTKKLCIFWIDYSLINIFSILFMLFYLIKLLVLNKKREPNPYELSRGLFPIAINISFTASLYTMINSLIFDGISSFSITSKIKKLSKINSPMDLLTLFNRLKQIGITDILDTKIYFIYLIIFSLVNLGLIILFTFAYTDINLKISGLLNIENYYIYLLRFYHLLVLLILIIGIIIMNNKKNSLICFNYHNNDLFAQKLYNVFSNQAIYFSNILTYRLIADLFITIPILLFLSLHMLDTICLIVSQLSIFIYLLLGGIVYFKIDENNKITQLSPFIKKIFCLDKINFRYDNKNINSLFYDFNYQYNSDEINIIRDLKLTIFKNTPSELSENEHNLVNLPLLTDPKSASSSTKLFNIDVIKFKKIPTSDRNLSSIPKNNFKTNIDFTNICDYYIIYKLILMNFKENSSIYENALKKMNENNNFFKKISGDNAPFRRRKSSAFNNLSITLSPTINKKELLYNIERISRISLTDSTKLSTNLKLSAEKLFLSLEEKDIFEEFKNEYGMMDNNIEFKIETLFSDAFFEIIPFLQLNINNILKSLEPSYNKKLFEVFIKKISPYKNKLEQNIFYTYDSLLSLEVYDKNDFIEFEDLKKFVYIYKDYLLKTLKNMDYTFLPLLLGIYYININGLSKIVIIYRNPLNFTTFSNFNNWVAFLINEGPEKLKASLSLDDVIDINEIEVKDSLKINEADYEEVQKILSQDLEFLKEINILIFPIVRLFIGDENDAIKGNTGDNLGYNKNYNQLNANEPSIFEETSFQKQQSFGDLIDNSNVLDFSKRVSNEFIDVEVTSLLEKEYYSLSGNDIHTIKIYFTNLFRTGKDLNRKKKEFLNDDKKDVTLSYRNFITEQMFIYFTKAKPLFEENDKEAKKSMDLKEIINKIENEQYERKKNEEKKEEEDSDNSFKLEKSGDNSSIV